MAVSKSIRINPIFAMACAVTVLAPLQPAAAEVCYWRGGNGNYFDKNWNNCSTPGEKDNVVIGSVGQGGSRFVDITKTAKLHDFLTYGSNVSLFSRMEVHGNNFENWGGFTVKSGGYLRSYSKNLVIFGGGSIGLDGGDIGGNITFGNSKFNGATSVVGAGTVGNESNLLFNYDGRFTANKAGRELLFVRSIDGGGTYESRSGGILHFTDNSSGDILSNQGQLVLDGNFTVGSDYNGNFGSGNSFNARANVFGGGGIFAASAGQAVSITKLSGNTIDFGAARVGDFLFAHIAVTNTGGQTTLRGAIQTNHAASVSVYQSDFALAPGVTQGTNLAFSTATAGAFSGQSIDVVNNFGNVAGQSFFAKANIYALAQISLASDTVDFGTVRKGTGGVTASLSIGNSASGALTDQLATSFGSTTPAISLISAPGYIAAGSTGTAIYGLDTSRAGAVQDYQNIYFSSHNNELADQAVGSQYVSFTGTVTDSAIAALTLASGDGIFSGSGNAYTLDLGSFTKWSDASATDVGVINAVLFAYFSETLGGGFTLSGDDGFSFAGDRFTGLAGGATDLGNWLSFNARGLAAGDYTGILTFNGFSHYPGLDDLALRPIKLTITASVTGGVPEPTNWTMMLAGFGAVGTACRKRARKVRAA